MSKDMFIDEYKIIRNKNNTVLLISTNVESEIKDNVCLSFTNIPFKINLENNGHLEFLKELKTIILVIANEEGNPEDFMELEIKEVS
jgi:hypothetical protein